MMHKTAGRLWVSTLLYFIALQAPADTSDLLHCTRDLVYQRKGDGQLLSRLASLLTHQDESSLMTCKDLLAEYRSAPAQPLSPYLDQIDSLDSPPGIHKLLFGFAKPTYNCIAVGGYIGAELFLLGGTGSMDFALCRSTLGNRWLEIRPSLEGTVGLGLSIGGGVMLSWDSNVNYTQMPVSITPRASLDISLPLVSLRAASRGQLFPNSIGAGVEFGLKIAGSGGMQLNITTLPLGTDYNYLTQIMSDDR